MRTSDGTVSVGVHACAQTPMDTHAHTHTHTPLGSQTFKITGAELPLLFYSQLSMMFLLLVAVTKLL